MALAADKSRVYLPFRWFPRENGDGLRSYNVVKNDNGKVVFIKHIDNPKK